MSGRAGGRTAAGASPSACLRSLAPGGAQGSICLNGVSLGGNLGADRFSVAIIPTPTTTVFRSLRPGHRVNVEFDVLGKYVERMLAGR